MAQVQTLTPSDGLLPTTTTSPQMVELIDLKNTNAGVIAKTAAAKDPDNTPPYSRIFIVCNKSTTEDELTRAFGQFGNIEYCRMLRDRDSQQSKGLCYIKYSQTSSAARAIEQMNGVHLRESLPPIKVQIADAKGSRKILKKQYTNEPEDTPARSRLFVVCPRDLVEDQLTREFECFGDLEYCKIMTDRQTNQSKGFAYVKFKLASTAAHAMETINETGRLDGRKVKVLIADPKAKRSSEEEMDAALGLLPEIAEPMFNYPLYYHQGAPYSPPFPMAPTPFATAYDANFYVPYTVRQRLFVVCSKRMTQEQLSYLFGRFPGLEYCDLKRDKITGDSKGYAFVNYNNPQSAYLATEQFDGIEYPQGSILKVMLAEPHVFPAGMPLPLTDASTAGANVPMSVPVDHQFVPMVGSPPFMPYPAMALPMAATAANMYELPYAQIPEDVSQMPPQSPSRVFFLLSSNLSNFVLEDIFSRFGKIKSLAIETSNPNAGYVQFSTHEEVQRTLNNLNEVQVNGESISIRLSLRPVVAAAAATPITATTTATTATTTTTAAAAAVAAAIEQSCNNENNAHTTNVPVSDTTTNKDNSNVLSTSNATCVVAAE